MFLGHCFGYTFNVRALYNLFKGRNQLTVITIEGLQFCVLVQFGVDMMQSAVAKVSRLLLHNLLLGGSLIKRRYARVRRESGGLCLFTPLDDPMENRRVKAHSSVLATGTISEW